MSIKIMSLTKAFNNAKFDTNEKKSTLLLQAGVEHYEVCCYLRQADKDETLWLKASVHFPLMHTCLELLAKALATKIDLVTPPKQHNHGTLKLMKHYRKEIPIFDSILTDAEKCNLIKQLEKAYLLLKYGEGSYYVDMEVIDLFEAIAEELADAYYIVTGFPSLAKHYPVK